MEAIVALLATFCGWGAGWGNCKRVDRETLCSLRDTERKLVADCGDMGQWREGQSQAFLMKQRTCVKIVKRLT